jgi:hypothetical protein
MEPGNCFCIDTSACFIGDTTQIHFFVKRGISWIKISKLWNNPFAVRGIRTIKHEYVNQVWIRDFSEFEKLYEVIKPHYNECRPHQSFDNKTPVEVRIAVTDDKRET